MERRTKNITAFVLVVFLAFGIFCSTLAAPGRALAAVTGCSQMGGGMAMGGCENLNYLCGSNPANNLLSSGAVASTRSNDSLKDALALGASAIDVSTKLAPPGAREWKSISLAEPGKVSVRLLNSTLNL
jgi:hypothetical protein